ncbi:MAG: hypothetical protein ACYCU7_13575 [Acidimicrobiales bacterium]
MDVVVAMLVSSWRCNGNAELLARQLKAELAKLDKQEENLIELAAEGEMVVAKVRQRLAEVQRKRGLVAARMDSEVERLEVGIRLIEGALQLLRDPLDLYLRMSPEGQSRGR